jgi:hypothetical protein
MFEREQKTGSVGAHERSTLRPVVGHQNRIGGGGASDAGDVASLIRLQRQIGNRATAALTARRPSLQRELDPNFKAAGTTTAKEMGQCKAFAQKVSDLVDNAYDELLTGNVKHWKGSKIATFLSLLDRTSPYALPWAGNAIEERVYALMAATDMGLKWVPQFAEGMGSASKPDIVVELPSGKTALIDITSDRFHIEGKAGGWLTSDSYVYLAEAWFPSVLAEHLTVIRKGVSQNGITKEHAKKLLADAEELRAAKQAEFKKGQAEARKELRAAGSFANYVRTVWGNDRTAASRFLQEWGIAAKGATRRKGPRRPSPEALAARKRKASAKKYQDKKRKREEESESTSTAMKVEKDEEEEEQDEGEEITERPTKKARVSAPEKDEEDQDDEEEEEEF